MKSFVLNMLGATVILLLVSVGSILTIDQGVAKEDSGPHWADTEVARAGQNVFFEAGCANCHSYIGQQGQVGGPKLDWVGDKYDEAMLTEIMVNPKKFFPETIMPSYDHLSQDKIETIAKYLATFKQD